MTPIRAEDLPKHVRDRLGIPNTSTKPSRAGVGDNTPCPGRCDCGAEFPTYRAWVKHCDQVDPTASDGARHRRWTIDLEGVK